MSAASSQRGAAPQGAQRDVVPRGALIGAAILIALTLAAVTYVRLTGPSTTVPTSTPVASRDLRFIDQPDGSIAVIEASTEKTIYTIAPSSDFFIRGTMRTMATERKHNGLGEQIPFRITRWADGRLTLQDDATGRSVELESFGATNEAAFAKLLDARGTP